MFLEKMRRFLNANGHARRVAMLCLNRRCHYRGLCCCPASCFFLATHCILSGNYEQAIWLLTTGAREAAFRNIKTIAECLADELVNAAKGSSNRFVGPYLKYVWAGPCLCEQAGRQSVWVHTHVL
jgi:hypothetical protein